MDVEDEVEENGGTTHAREWSLNASAKYSTASQAYAREAFAYVGYNAAVSILLQLNRPRGNLYRVLQHTSTAPIYRLAKDGTI